MAGHSKWANIQHRKGRQDARRGRLFSRLIREVTVAARLGGPNADANLRLRAAIVNAAASNIPKDTIERAIRRATSEGENEGLEEARYEGFGPGGMAVVVDCITDNRKRTIAEVRHVFKRHGGNLDAGGAVKHLFRSAGRLAYPSDCGVDRLFEVAADAGAEEVFDDGNGGLEVQTAPADFAQVRERLEAAGFKAQRCELTLLPNDETPLDRQRAEPALQLLSALEELEDVQQVYCNAAFPEHVPG